MSSIVLAALPTSWSVPKMQPWLQNSSLWGLALCLLSWPFLTHIRQGLPEDLLQGHSVQFLYGHVPWAFASLAWYSIITALSVFYLLWPIKWVYYLITSALWPIWLCTVWTLLSGALWGYQTWGTLWIWDARLTSFLVLSAFVAFLGFWSNLQPRSMKSYRKVFCIFVIIGFFDVILTHFAVVWFKTLHQGSGLLRLTTKSTVDPIFARPLWYHIFHMFFLNTCLIFGHFSLQVKKEISR